MVQFFWSDRESLGMHFGFWEQNTLHHKEALINQYRVVKKLLDPQQGDTILDAGCGIGGASLWLAQNSDAHYTGITISKVQLNQARDNAKKRHLEEHVSFSLGNFFDTDFGDATFDKIFCIESACYAYPNPDNLYKELYRILKPNGVMVISDGVLLRHPVTPKEKSVLSAWFDAWALSGGCTIHEVQQALKRSGFQDVTFLDRTSQIEPHVKKLGFLGRFLYTPLRLLCAVRLFSQTGLRNAVAARAQQAAYTLRLFGYGVFSARKIE